MGGCGKARKQPSVVPCPSHVHHSPRLARARVRVCMVCMCRVVVVCMCRVVVVVVVCVCVCVRVCVYCTGQPRDLGDDEPVH